VSCIGLQAQDSIHPVLLRLRYHRISAQAQLPALVQRATVKHKAVGPLCGRINSFTAGGIAYTGGNSYDSTMTGPAANSCYCPIEPDKVRKVEDKCVQTLVEARKPKPILQKLDRRMYC